MKKNNLILIAFLYVGVIYGQKMNIEVNPKAKAYSVDSIQINASVDKVYSLITNINDWPKWFEGVSQVQIDGVPEKGKAFIWKAKGYKIKSMIHTIQPLSAIGWTGSIWWINAVHNWQFVCLPGGSTKVIVKESFEGFGSSLMKNSLKTDMRNDLISLKTESEKQIVKIADTRSTESNSKLSIFAETNHQWTGIAISQQDRVFVNFPRWSDDTPISVAQIVDGKIIPYPNEAWNNWDSKEIVKNKFICVQSVVVDNLNRLWVLDPGYELSTDRIQGAHIYVFNLENDSLIRDYSIPIADITDNSYLNDICIDNQKGIAYISDSNIGGIVILDLKTGKVRRVLGNHHSTLSEVNQIVIEGYVRNHAVSSDGIALDPDKKTLYYCALMGENVYRVPTRFLLDTTLNEKQLGNYVEKFAKTGANDGIAFDKKGNLYLSSLEKNAISIVDSKGVVQELVSNDKIQWPDSFSFDSNEILYFTTSQIHLPKEKRSTYKIFKLTLRRIR